MKRRPIIASSLAVSALLAAALGTAGTALAAADPPMDVNPKQEQESR